MRRTSRKTETTTKFLAVDLQLEDLLFILEIRVASSLDMYCNRFSKSSPCNLNKNKPFQTRDQKLLLLFLLSSPSTSAIYPLLNSIKYTISRIRIEKTKSHDYYSTETLSSDQNPNNEIRWNRKLTYLEFNIRLKSSDF